MAAGLAVAGTDIEGVREVVGPSSVQLLATPGDAEALAVIILKLAEDSSLCARIGRENRKRVEERFNSERMCEETASLLKILCVTLRRIYGGLMQHLKQRLLAVLLILASIAMIYYGWYSLRVDGVYYLKMAAFAPLLGVGGIFLLFFPSLAGKPNTTKEKVIVMVVFAIGLLAGLINWYLMDPGFFSFLTGSKE